MSRAVDYMVTGSTAAGISGLYAMLGRQVGSMTVGNQNCWWPANQNARNGQGISCSCRPPTACPPRRIYSFGTQKASASDHLFTFLLHEYMEPTNNSIGREIRYPAIHRKIRGQIGSAEKMARFGILLTCILTWRKQKLNFYQEMDRILLIHA